MTIYRIIFASVLFSPLSRCQKANLRLCEFSVANNISAHATASGRIQDGEQKYASVKGRK